MRPSTKAWGVLGIGVAGYDLLCPSGETLSEGVDRAMEAHKLLTIAAVGVTALHLANVLHPSIDPFTLGLKLIKGPAI